MDEVEVNEKREANDGKKLVDVSAAGVLVSELLRQSTFQSIAS